VIPGLYLRDPSVLELLESAASRPEVQHSRVMASAASAANHAKRLRRNEALAQMPGKWDFASSAEALVATYWPKGAPLDLPPRRGRPPTDGKYLLSKEEQRRCFVARYRSVFSPEGRTNLPDTFPDIYVSAPVTERTRAAAARTLARISCELKDHWANYGVLRAWLLQGQAGWLSAALRPHWAPLCAFFGARPVTPEEEAAIAALSDYQALALFAGHPSVIHELVRNVLMSWADRPFDGDPMKMPLDPVEVCLPTGAPRPGETFEDALDRMLPPVTPELLAKGAADLEVLCGPQALENTRRAMQAIYAETEVGVDYFDIDYLKRTPFIELTDSYVETWTPEAMIRRLSIQRPPDLVTRNPVLATYLWKDPPEGVPLPYKEPAPCEPEPPLNQGGWHAHMAKLIEGKVPVDHEDLSRKAPTVDEPPLASAEEPEPAPAPGPAPDPSMSEERWTQIKEAREKSQGLPLEEVLAQIQANLGTPLEVVRQDVEAFAEAERLSEEDAARVMWALLLP
jgi:hypothetical protein